MISRIRLWAVEGVALAVVKFTTRSFPAAIVFPRVPTRLPPTLTLEPAVVPASVTVPEVLRPYMGTDVIR